MYDFHKIKNDEGYNEFKHILFKRDQVDDLYKIKRKVNEYSQIADEYSGDKKAIMSEFQKLKKDYKELEDSLSIIAAQNKRLVDSNKDLVCQLYFFKKEYEIRVRKLLFLFFVLVKNYTPELVLMIKDQVDSQNMLKDGNSQNNQFSNLKEFIDLVSQKIMQNNEQSDSWLNSIFELFKKYINENQKGDKGESQDNFKSFMEAIQQNGGQEQTLKQIRPQQGFQRVMNRTVSLQQRPKYKKSEDFFARSEVQSIQREKKFSEVYSQIDQNNLKQDLKDDTSSKMVSENSLMDESKSDLNSINLMSPNWQRKSIKRDFFNF